MMPVRPSRTITRRAVLGGAATLPALAACGVGGGSDGAPAVSKTPVTIEYMTALNARQESNAKELLVEAFEKAHAPHKVTLTPREAGFTKLQVAVAAGTPPDVVWVFGPEVFLGKLVEDMTPLVRRDKVNTGLFPKAPFETSATWRGKVFGLPNQTGGNWPVMPYNRDLFRQAGLAEPPAKWGEASWNANSFLEALQKTTKAGPDGKQLSLGLNAPGAGYLTQDWPGVWNAAWVSDDYKTVQCDSAQMIEAMEYMVALVTRHKVASTGNQLRDLFGDNDARRNFTNGKLAMHQTAGGGTFAIAQAAQEQNLNLAYAPLPTFKKVGAGQNVDSNAIPMGAKHREEGWLYIKWASDTPNWAISRGNAPARADHFDTWIKTLYPGDLAAKMRVDVYRESLKFAGKLDPIGALPSYRQISDEIIGPAITRMFAGQASVAATLREIKAPIQALVPKELP